MEHNRKAIKNSSKCNGFSVIEIIIVTAIVSIAFFGISRVVLLSQKLTIESKQKGQALYLTKEALESVRSARDENWDNISELIMDAEYHPIFSGTPSRWQLASGSQNIDEFTRKIVFQSVSRDVNDNIEEVYNPDNDDAGTKKVTATVSFKGDKKQVEITTYITNWR